MTRRRFPYIAAGFALAAGMWASAPALAWDRLGHALVASLAEEQLSPQARAQIAELLPDETEPRLAAIASWADELRGESRYRDTSTLHYVNFAGECHSNPARDCPDGRCVIAAVDHYSRTLGDTGKPLAERTEALKFLVHVVGDVHQPLHAGRRNDRGGNQFQVNIKGEGSNLHRVWDHDVLGSAGLNRAQYHEQLLKTPLPPPGTLDPVEWAEASCHLTDATGFYPKKPGKLAASYPESQRPLAEAQVRLAASRLAAILERELGGIAVTGP